MMKKLLIAILLLACTALTLMLEIDYHVKNRFHLQM